MSFFNITTNKSFKALIAFVAMAMGSSPALSQGIKPSGLEHLFTSPLTYTTVYTSTAPAIDGDLSDPAWAKAAWTESFTDIEGTKRPKPPLETKVKMMWDDQYLYIAAEMEEPHVWGTLKEHDEVVFYDNDFEVFIDPDNNGHQYFEVEVNALNTIFDLFLSKPYRNNSGALISWDAKGLKSAVKINGTLNDPKDKDKGWSVEMAIPFSNISMGDNTRVPREGSLWRINFSRVEWDTEVIDGKYVKKKDANGKALPEHNWVWSPQGVINMHFPERWGYLKFTKNAVSEAATRFPMPYIEKQRQYLWLAYYKQKEYQTKNKKYASTLANLGLEKTVTIDGKSNKLTLESTAKQFTITITAANNESWCLNEEGLVRKL